MGWMRRLTVVVLATLLTLVAWAPRAQAVGNTDAARKAAGYVAAQAPSTSDVGAAASSLVALAAVNDVSLAPQAAQLLQAVEGGASDHAAASPVGAARLVILAVSLGQDPRAFAGVDLVAAVKDGIKADGSFSDMPGPAASGLAIVALTRAQEPVPTLMAQHLVRLANPDGGFGYGTGQPSDADSTGLAMLGMLTQTDSISARDAVGRAVSWATAQQQADGSWTSANPVISTAILGSALQAAGQQQPRAVQYLVAQQLPDGSLPAEGHPDLAATQQAALLLGATSYLTVSSPALAGALASAAPTPTATAPATAAPSTAAPTSPATTTPDVPRGNENGILWVILPIVLLMLLGGAAFLMFGRGRADAPPPPPATEAPVTGEPAGPAPEATHPDAPADTPAEPTPDVPAHPGPAKSSDESDAAREFGLPEEPPAGDPPQRPEPH